MTPINSISHTPVYGFRSQAVPSQRTTASLEEFSSHTAFEPHLAITPEIDPITQLPQEQVQNVTDIFRSINIVANQALEPGQNFENRETLQAQVEGDILELNAALTEFEQDDLTLLIAIFQNQLPEGIIASGRRSNGTTSDPAFTETSGSTLESLLRIDVTTEPGALTALDLTGSIIASLARNNNDSSLLESLLDNLTESVINVTIADPLTEDQESEETTTSQDNNAEELLTQIPPLSSPASNPQTIIDFAG